MKSWRPIMGAVVGLLVGSLIVLIIVQVARTATLTDAIRETQKANTAKNEQQSEQLRIIQHLARRIDSCTTPGEPCSRRGQRNQAKAVGSINRVVILASACSVGVDPKLPVEKRQELIQTCVINRLASSP